VTGPAAPDEPQHPDDRDDPHGLLERLKELDHAHLARPGRSRLRSGWGLALSLRFVRSAARRLITPTEVRTPVAVPAPAPGALAVTFVGHASAMLTTSQTRVLTDPCFANFLWGLRRAQAACLHADDADDVALVLISHAHRDHLHRPSLHRLPRSATVVVPPGCAGLVESLGFADVVGLEPGDVFNFRDLRITAVAARHDGRRGLFDRRWRGASGYLIASPDVTAYFVGDSGYFSGFRELGRRRRPDVALLPIAGYEPLALRASHMSPLDAVAAFEDLGAEVLVPIAHGAFPLGYEPLEAPLSWLRQLCAERGLAARLAALSPGDTCLVRRGQSPEKQGQQTAVDDLRPLG
jgi:L-ascorbate metabolism protein UlaG (beta-lactamase superfamily)